MSTYRFRETPTGIELSIIDGRRIEHHHQFDMDEPFEGERIQIDDLVFDRNAGEVLDGNRPLDAKVWPEEALDLYFLFEFQCRQITNRDVCVALGLIEFNPREFLDARH